MEYEGAWAQPARLHLAKSGIELLQRASTSGSTVLVVDDEDAIRDFLRSALEAEGYRVLAAGDGEAALSVCERYRPDIILLDLMMPRLDGLGFLRMFHRRYGKDGATIFIMSAVAAAVEHVRGSDVAGAFIKPFDLDELLETINAHARSGGGPQRDNADGGYRRS